MKFDPEGTVRLSVSIEQEESDGFRRYRSSLSNQEAKNYNRLVLAGIKRHIGRQPGVILDDSASLKVTIRTVLPESSRNTVGAGITSCLTLMVIPLWVSFEYPVEVVLSHDGEILQRNTYSYRLTGMFGWLMIPTNLLVSTWHPDFFISVENRDAGVDDQFEWFFQDVSADVVQKARQAAPSPIEMPNEIPMPNESPSQPLN